MAKFNATLGVVVTQDNKPFMGPVTVPWYGISGDHLDVLLKTSNDAQDAAAKAANRGGNLTLTLSRSAEAIDGGTVPPGFNGARTFLGLTLDSLNDFQDASQKAGNDLRKLGRAHAKVKHKSK